MSIYSKTTSVFRTAGKTRHATQSGEAVEGVVRGVLEPERGRGEVGLVRAHGGVRNVQGRKHGSPKETRISKTGAFL